MPILTVILSAILTSFASRIITSFGVGIVTYTGYMYALDKIQSSMTNFLNSVPEVVLNLIYMSGFATGLGYILGAWSFRITIVLMKKLSFGLS